MAEDKKAAVVVVAAAEKEEKELGPILLTVNAEHVATPHGVELRRNGSKFVEDARTQDFASTEAIGARTIENILRDAGANLPSGKEEVVISFSPHTGEVIAVAAA